MKQLWRTGLGIGLLFAMTCLNGCKVNEAQEIAAYRQIIDAGQPGAPIHFVTGQPLTLQLSLQLANANNERLPLHGEDYLQAIIARDRALSAFQPTVSFGPTYFQEDPVAIPPTTPHSLASQNQRYDAPVSGQMNLFNGFRDIQSLYRAASTIDQRKALLLDAQAQLLIDVAGAYYQTVRAERSVEVLRESARTQQARVDDMRAKLQAGLARALDLKQIEAQASATRVALVRAVSDVDNGRSMLSFLLGVEVGTSPLVDSFEPRLVVPLADLIQQALSLRQDVVAAHASTEAARRNVQVAIGEYYPSLSLNVNYFLARETPPTNSFWNYIFTFNLPIFSAGLIHADVRNALSQLRQAALAETMLGRQVEQDVRIAYDNLGNTEAQLQELRIEVAAAREAYRLADELEKHQVGTALDRLIAFDRLLSSELDLTSAQIDRKYRYLTLMRVTGKLPNPASLLAVAATTQPATQPVPPTTIPSTNPASGPNKH